MKKLLAMVLALVMTLSLAVSASAFKDAKDVSADYAEAVAVLNGMDVFKGYEDGSFKPQGNITRAEVATIIYRIYTGDVAKNDKSGLYASYNKFTDMTGAGWAAGYIGYYEAQVYVDGELKWVQVSMVAGETLNDNVGKLYKAAKWNKSTDSDYFGQLKQVELVTEANDSEWASNKVVADYVYSGTLDGKVLESRDSNGNVENSWWIGDAKVISVDGKTTELTKDVLKTQSVWVVSKETKREGVADYIFIGDKLGDVASDAAKALEGADLGDIVLTDATLDTMKAAAVKKAESILNDKGITGITVEVSYTAKDDSNVNFVPALGTEETIWFQFKLTDSADSVDYANSCKADVTNNYSKDSLEAAIKATLEGMTEITDSMTTAAANDAVKSKLASYDLDDLTVEVEGKLETKNQVTVTVTGTDADLGAVSASAKVVVANA